VIGRLVLAVVMVAVLACGPAHRDTSTVVVGPIKGANGVSSRPAPEHAAVRWGRLPTQPGLLSACVIRSKWTMKNHEARGTDVTESDRLLNLDAQQGADQMLLAFGTGEQLSVTVNGKPRNEALVLVTEGGRYSVGRGSEGTVRRLPSNAEVTGDIASSARGLAAFLVDLPPLLPESSTVDSALDDGVAVALTTHVAAVFDHLFVGVELPKATLLGVADRDGVPVARIELSAIVKWPKTRWMRAEIVGEALIRIDNGMVVELSAKGTSGPTKLEDRGKSEDEFAVTTRCDHGVADSLRGRPALFEGSR